MLRAIANFCLTFATAVAVYLTFFSPEDQPPVIAASDTMYFSVPVIPDRPGIVSASGFPGILEGLAAAARKIPSRETQTVAAQTQTQAHQTQAQRARNKLAAAELAGRFAVPDETEALAPAKVQPVVDASAIETPSPDNAQLVANSGPLLPNQAADDGLASAARATTITLSVDAFTLDGVTRPLTADTVALSNETSFASEAAAGRSALHLPAASHTPFELSHAGSSVELADGKPQRLTNVSAATVKTDTPPREQSLDAVPVAATPVSRVASLPLMRVGPMPTLASDKAGQVDVAASWASDVLRADWVALDRKRIADTSGLSGMIGAQQDGGTAAAELQDTSPTANGVRASLNKKPLSVRTITLSNRAAAVALNINPDKMNGVRVAALGAEDAAMPPSTKTLTAWQAMQPASKTKSKLNAKAASKNKRKAKTARRNNIAPVKLVSANNPPREVISWRPPKHKTHQHFAPLLSHCNEFGCKTDER